LFGRVLSGVLLAVPLVCSRMLRESIVLAVPWRLEDNLRGGD